MIFLMHLRSEEMAVNESTEFCVLDSLEYRKSLVNNDLC